MKSNYIYLVTINHPDGPYYYVGSHTWDGPEGELDPNYHGSCHYGAQFGLVRWGEHTKVGKIYYDWCHKYGFVESILEVVSERAELSRREVFWIRIYFEKFGAKLRGAPGKKFLDKYEYGKVLNGDLGGHENLKDPIIVRKRADTRKRNGGYKDCSQLHTPEAREKAYKNHDYSNVDYSGLLTEESRKKAHEARKARGYEWMRDPEFHKRKTETVYKNAKRKVLCISPTGEEFVCCGGQLKNLIPDMAGVSGIISRMFRGLLPEEYKPTTKSKLFGWTFKIYKNTQD